jgi:hypothetical protein
MTSRTAGSPKARISSQTLNVLPSTVSSRPRSTSGSTPILCAALALLLPLTGCGVVASSSPGAIATNTTLTGRVHGGQQPVAGATITLYAPGATGYGSAPTVITTTTTDSAGNFTLPTYSCPSPSPITYIVATGGNPGAGPNPNLAEAALLPACSSLTPTTFIYISEVTTVAAAYALAPFAALSPGTTNIGTSAANILGLTNALGPASNLANTVTGNARGVNDITGLILPTAEINTLADILAACVNTNTNGVPSTTCNTLFTAATPPSGTAPTDTFQAAIDIALNPGNNAATLYGLATAIAPYQPTLASAPPDFAVGIRYVGGLIGNSGGTAGIDIDAAGNAWVLALAKTALGTNANITEISPAGAFLSGANGYLNGDLMTPTAIAIDSSGNVFTTDYGNNEIVKSSPSGALISDLNPPSLNHPGAIALDNSNSSAWIANVLPPANTVTNMTSTGADATDSPHGSMDFPIGVAVDAAANIWVANSDFAGPGSPGDGFLTKFTPSGGTYSPLNFNTGPNTVPFDVAIDASNGVWVTDLIGVAHFDNSGNQLSPTGGYLQTPTTAPEAIIVDGLNRTWVSNAATDNTGHFFVPGLPGSVSVFDNSGNPLSSSSTTPQGTLLRGYTAVGTIPRQPTTPQGIKIDASGNVWVTGFNGGAVAPVVTELVGIAAPVTTPISVAAATGKLGKRP